MVIRPLTSLYLIHKSNVASGLTREKEYREYKYAVFLSLSTVQKFMRLAGVW